MEILIVAVLIGLIPAIIAANKGHNFVLWWLFGAVLFIVALPMALLIKPNENALDLIKMRKCPYCAELIKREATVCRYCGRELPKITPSTIETPTKLPPAKPLTRRDKIVLLGVFAVVVLFIVGSAWFFESFSESKPPDTTDTIKYDTRIHPENITSPTPDTTDTIKYDTQIHPENIIQDAPAPSPTNETTSAPATETVTLTKPVSVQLQSGTVTLPAGTKLEFVSQVGTKVHVRYLNSDQMIPISATDLK
jgi:zinc-ribbon domain